MSYRTLSSPPGGPLDALWTYAREIYEVMRWVMQGKLNATLDVTLTANSATTVVSDPRLTATSFIGFMPTTVDAATEFGAGTLRVGTQGTGVATVTHANIASTTRTFRLLVIG